MIDTQTISKELSGMVGLYKGFYTNWESQFNPAYYHLNPSVYLSDAHKLLRTDILNALGPNVVDMNLDNTPTYSAETPFARYDIVSGSYESQVDNNIGHPLTDTNYWKKTTPLSIWYGRIEGGGIDKLCRSLAQNPPASALFDRQPLYNKESNIQGKLNKSGRFLGLRLRVKGKNTAVNLARIGFQLTGSGIVTNLPIYLFHSEQSTPIATVQLSGTVTGRSLWVDVNKYLYKRSGGYYIIGYFESDLPSTVYAVGAERGFTVDGCSSCFGVDYSYAQNRAPYLLIEPVYVTGPLVSGNLSWASEETVRLQTWGINLVIEARCDVTQSLLDNREMLTNALLHTIACDVLEELSTNDRLNGMSATMKSQAYVALYGQQNSKTDFGLSVKRDKLITDLKAVMAKQAPTCLAQEAPRRGIRFGSMYD